MINRIVTFALKKRVLVVVLALILAMGGVIAFKELPIEAYPDIADTWVQIITQWTGHASEEVETQVTIPIEIAMTGVPHRTQLRSVTLAGLSVVTLLFDEQTKPFDARLYVMERLSQANMPPNVQPRWRPMSSPVGQVMFYVLDSKNRTPMELKELEDWELEKRWKEVEGVADVSSFGGTVKQFQALLNPASMASYGLATSNVVQALSANNQNSGGGFIVRGCPGLQYPQRRQRGDNRGPRNVIVSQKTGTPIRVKNLGQVVVGPQTRLGKISMSEHRPDGTVDDRDDVVEGIVMSRTGESDESVLDGIHKKLKDLNEHYLPKDIQIKPYLDRSDLIHLTTHTVEENLTVGHGPGFRDPALFPGQPQKRADRGFDHSALAADCLDFSGSAPYPGQSAFSGRAGFRHGGRRRGRHDREHLPPQGGAQEEGAFA